MAHQGQSIHADVVALLNTAKDTTMALETRTVEVTQVDEGRVMQQIARCWSQACLRHGGHLTGEEGAQIFSLLHKTNDRRVVLTFSKHLTA